MDRGPAALPRPDPPHPLVDPAVDLALDAVEEARHERVVVLRAELAPSGQGGVQLVSRVRIDARTLGDWLAEGKDGLICYNDT